MAVAVSGHNPGGCSHAQGGKKCARFAAGIDKLVPTDRLEDERLAPTGFGGGVDSMDELSADTDGVEYLAMKSSIEWLAAPSLNFSTNVL